MRWPKILFHGLADLKCFLKSVFEEDDEFIVLSANASLEPLKGLKTKLDFLLNSIDMNRDRDRDGNKMCATTLPIDKKRSPMKADPSRIIKSPNRPSSSANSDVFNHNKFALKLQNAFDHVLIYENAELRQKALDKIPVERLKEEAMAKFYAYKLNLKSYDSKPFDFNDFLLLELQSWFKNEFFSWVNEPDCDYCSSKEFMKFAHSAQPVSHEVIWLANNVEVYKCSKCQKSTRFPRYNHPEKLLETRKGRCGEWANCYCLCLRALDFDARYILDWTDHVWCEVYSSSQKRWLHSDPCENSLDKPLLYEHGWKKNLSYVIAFSAYECLDVTWRYSSKHKEVMQRRRECDEEWLIKFTHELSRKRQVTLPKEKRDQIQLRMVKEIVEFLSPKQLKEGEDVGRQSGSLQWRINRGEIEANSSTAATAGMILKIDSALYSSLATMKVVSLKYNTVNDSYTLTNYLSSLNDQEKNSWKKMAYKYEKIQRKVENDWKMCYLARTVGSAKASIEWHFDLFTDLKQAPENVEKSLIEKFEIVCESSCFQSGRITWTLSLLDSQTNNRIAELILDQTEEHHSNQPICSIYSNGRFQIKSTTTSDGSFDRNFLINKRAVLRADLERGDGENAWQHTQLFRQKLTDTDKFLFEFSIFFS